MQVHYAAQSKQANRKTIIPNHPVSSTTQWTVKRKLIIHYKNALKSNMRNYTRATSLVIFLKRSGLNSRQNKKRIPSLEPAIQTLLNPRWAIAHYSNRRCSIGWNWLATSIKCCAVSFGTPYTSTLTWKRCAILVTKGSKSPSPETSTTVSTSWANS